MDFESQLLLENNDKEQHRLYNDGNKKDLCNDNVKDFDELPPMIKTQLPNTPDCPMYECYFSGITYRRLQLCKVVYPVFLTDFIEENKHKEFILKVENKDDKTKWYYQQVSFIQYSKDIDTFLSGHRGYFRSRFRRMNPCGDIAAEYKKSMCIENNDGKKKLAVFSGINLFIASDRELSATQLIELMNDNSIKK